tara:strand:- start:439 stop:1407 length:969 start_codon:yes stop_codon:yes gene_type:complete
MITGCVGFIGTHLTKKLLSSGYIIRGIDNMIDDYITKQNNLFDLQKYEHFSFIQGDITNTNEISSWKPHKIIHLASLAGVRNSIKNPLLYERVNVGGFIHLMEESVKNNVNLVVFASSSSVYGLNNKVPFCESDQVNSCNSQYACSKLAMEMYAKTYYQLYNLSSIGLRFFTVYGPGGRKDMAPYKFLNAITNGTPFEKFGDGMSSRDYTYIDDIVDGIIAALENKKNIKCEIYNLGNSLPVTLNEFISTCEKITGKKAIYNQRDMQLGDVPHTFADISKAGRDLDYKPKVNLHDGLTKFYENILAENKSYLKECPTIITNS